MLKVIEVDPEIVQGKSGVLMDIIFSITDISWSFVR